MKRTMKPRKLILALSATLLLASCGGKPESSSSSHATGLTTPDTSSVTTPEGETTPAEPSSTDVAPESSDTKTTNPEYTDTGTTPVESSDTTPAESEDSDTAKEESSEEDPFDWTAAQKDLMKEHLHGLVLPYFYLYDAEVGYDAVNNMVTVTTIDALDEGELSAYADSFLDEDWDLEDISDEYDLNEGNVFMAFKAVETDEGTRFVQTVFATVDDKGNPDTTGTLMLMATDPYTYEWPAEFAAAASEYFGSEAVVPAFEADYYEFSASNISKGYVSIYAYTDDADAEDVYAGILETAGWTVSNGVNEYGYFEAIAPSEDLMVEYAYDSDYGDLDIYIEAYEPEITVWPAEYAAAAVEFFAPGSETIIPALEGADEYGIYVPEEYFDLAGYAEVDAYGEATLIDDFAAILTDAGWYDSDSGFISPDSDIIVSLKYNSSYGCVEVVIEGYEAPAATWPEDDVAAIVEAVVPGSETVVPPFVGGESYVVYADAYDAELYGYGEIDITGDPDLIDDYIATLLDAGWTAINDSDFVSPAEDIMIEVVYDEEYDLIEVFIAPYTPVITEWAGVAEGLADIVEALVPGSTTVIPALDGADKYEIYVGADKVETKGYGELDIYGDETLEDDYIAILLEANWTETDDGYVSPNKDILLEVGYNDWYGCLEVVIKKYVAPATAWPTADIATLLGDKVTDTVPAYAGEATGYRILNDAYGKGVQVLVEEGTEEDAIAAYETTLLDANYTKNGDYYVSPNGQLTISLYVGTPGSFTIDITVDPFLEAVKTFPATELATFLTTYDLGFSLDTLPDTAAGKGYIVSTGMADGADYHYFSITVSGNAFAAYDAIIYPLVTAAGYEYNASYSTANHIVYLNADNWHEVDVVYNTTANTTSVVFYE